MSDKLLYVTFIFDSRVPNRGGEALESFQEIFADARWTAPIKLSVAQATVYMRDSEGDVSLPARQWQFA